MLTFDSRSNYLIGGFTVMGSRLSNAACLRYRDFWILEVVCLVNVF